MATEPQSNLPAISSERGVDLPHVEPPAVLEQLLTNPDLSALSEAFGAPAAHRRERDSRFGSLVALVDEANRYINGDLIIPTLDDLMAAQQLQRLDPRSEILADTALEAIRGTIAKTIAEAHGLPTHTRSSSWQAGAALNEVARNLGVSSDLKESRRWVGENVLPQLTFAERAVLSVLLSPDTKLKDLGLFDVDIASSEDLANYLHSICYPSHGKEIQLDKDFTPSPGQIELFTQFMELLEGRSDGGPGFVPLNLREVMDNLLYDKSGEMKHHADDILKRLINIAFAEGDHEGMFRVLLANHPYTADMSQTFREIRREYSDQRRRPGDIVNAYIDLPEEDEYDGEY